MGRKSNAKERLTEVALNQFWQYGCNTVSVDRICREAGVLKGTFYHFFESKNAIILAALDAAWTKIREEVIEPAFDPELHPLRRIERLFLQIYEYQLSMMQELECMPGCPFFNMMGEITNHEKEVRERVNSLCKRYITYFEMTLLEAVKLHDFSGDPERTANKLFAYLGGAILQAKAKNDPQIILDLLPGTRLLMQTTRK